MPTPPPDAPVAEMDEFADEEVELEIGSAALKTDAHGSGVDDDDEFGDGPAANFGLAPLKSKTVGSRYGFMALN